MILEYLTWNTFLNSYKKASRIRDIYVYAKIRLKINCPLEMFNYFVRVTWNMLKTLQSEVISKPGSIFLRLFKQVRKPEKTTFFGLIVYNFRI